MPSWSTAGNLALGPLFDEHAYLHWLIFPFPVVNPPRNCGVQPVVLVPVLLEWLPASSLLPDIQKEFYQLLDLFAEHILIEKELIGSLFVSGILDEPPYLLPGLFRSDQDTVDGIKYALEEINRTDASIIATAVGAPFPPGVEAFEFTDAISLPERMRVPNSIPSKIVAIIDTDIPFLHDRFRSGPTQSRIQYFWDMDADVTTELYRSDINTILNTLATQKTSEEEAYRRYRSTAYPINPDRNLPPLMRSHGAHVLDQAAGRPNPNPAVPDDVAIFAARLPRWAVAQTHGAFLFGFVYYAMSRILERVAALEAAGAITNPEIHVNLSLGAVSGRHDGLSQFEWYLDGLLNLPQIKAVNVAAGNTRESNLHARFLDDKINGGSQTVDWRIQPGDGTFSILQIWLPEGADPHKLKLTVNPPGAHQARVFGFGDLKKNKFYEYTEGCEVLARLYIETDSLFFGLHERVAITLAVRHNAVHRDSGYYKGGRPDLAGVWQLTLEGKGDLIHAGEEVMIWVERDDPLRGEKTGARQSYLEGPSLRGDSLEDNLDNRVRRFRKAGSVDRDGTLSDIATGNNTTVVAAHFMFDRKMSPYSGEGFTFTQNGALDTKKPTTSAPGDRSRIRRGLLGAGYYSGSVRRYSGTSMATGLVTQLLLDKAQIEAKSTADDPLPPPPPESKRGKGRAIIPPLREKP